MTRISSSGRPTAATRGPTDHGATPPSALSARNVAATGATLSASVAAGIMSINRHHGGAIEDCARQLKAIADYPARHSISFEEAATWTVRTMSEAGEVHTKDPRTARLFELAREAGVDGVHMQAVRAVEKAFATRRKRYPSTWTAPSAPFSPIWE